MPSQISFRVPSFEEQYPQLFLQSKVDPQTRTRTVPMQVLCLGFPRTGTMSMQSALNLLGYHCYHSTHLFSNIRECAMWNAAMDAKFRGRGPRYTRVDWDRLLGHCSAVSADPPAVAFAEDLIAAYPDAKVILVEREIESWYKSFDAGVIEPLFNKYFNFVAACDPFLLGPISDCHYRWVRWWMGAVGKKDMQEKARDVYRSHYALVRRVTPKDKLLEYRMGDGWEPLCKFLGKEVPASSFPKVNDRESHQKNLRIIIRKGVHNVLKRAIRWLIPVVVIIFAGFLWSKTATTPKK